jgi:nanoRNase/pAp phosphatase (c-di-AMP/oligoRNAs hydrolase)
MNAGKKYRLITRSDFDGLVCAILFKELNMIDDIMFAHPKDMQDDLVEVTENDIVTNLPFNEKVHLCFDHHSSESLRNEGQNNNLILEPDAKSAARVVYNYYGGEKTFGSRFNDLMIAVDKADSADYTIDDILKPKDWVLVNYIMDSRTGLGRFKNFRVSNMKLMMDLIDYCRKHTIDEILQLPDVAERVELYFALEADFKEQLLRCSVRHKNCIVFDLRREKKIYPGNRFMIYALFPECNISIYILLGFQSQNTVFAVGKSILNRTSRSNVGDLMLKYGGGGHENAGTCQVAHERADQVLAELIQKINADG